MKKILEALNDTAGLLGSMVMTPDGMPVASSLRPDVEGEAMAALVSSLILAVGRGASGFGFSDGLNACYLNSTLGRVILVNLENAYLVVVAPLDLRIDANDQAIRGAIEKIKNRKVA